MSDLDEILSLRQQLRELREVRGAIVSDVVKWAVSRWCAEVKNRPLQNIHRRSLDTTWRQVIRHFGGDDVLLCGPPHDELLVSSLRPTE